MQIRKTVNAALRNSGYQIVKVFQPEQSCSLAVEEVLDDAVLAARILPERKHAWIVAAPKSGSTWLSASLRQLLGWHLVPLARRSKRGEQEVDVRQTLRFPGEHILSPQQHCRASPSTIEFIKRFRVKPIIQVRNIYDAVVSFRDHCLNESLLWSMAYIDDDFVRFSEDRQFQFIIEMVMPWYLNFYATWFQAEGLSPAELIYVRYEELVSNPERTLGTILDYLGESRPHPEIAEALEKVKSMNTRKNIGVVGRGERLLNDRHKARIMELRQYYPRIDFSLVGL